MIFKLVLWAHWTVHIFASTKLAKHVDTAKILTVWGSLRTYLKTTGLNTHEYMHGCVCAWLENVFGCLHKTNENFVYVPDLDSKQLQVQVKLHNFGKLGRVSLRERLLSFV